MHTSDIYVEWIARENIPIIWMLIKDRLEQTIQDWAEGEVNTDDLFDSLICGKSQLWIVNDKSYNIKLIGVTKVLQYPRINRLLIDIIVGSGIKEAQVLLPQVEQIMRHRYQVQQIEVHARPGLARILEKSGTFKRSRVVLLRDVEHADLSETQRQVGPGKA